MTFRGSYPYGTPGGFPGPLIVGATDDVREAEGKTYVAFLVINSTVIERRRSEIDEIIRVIGAGGVPIVAIALTEGDVSSGSVIDSAMTELRFGSQDFIAQQVSPGIVLVTLERNQSGFNWAQSNVDASTTTIGLDLSCVSLNLTLPGPASSTYLAVFWGFTIVDHSAAAGIAIRLDIVDSLGTDSGVSWTETVTGKSSRIVGNGIGPISGGQVITGTLYASIAVAGTLTKYGGLIVGQYWRQT